MAGFLSFVLVYTIGGLTFIPLLLAALLLHAHLTFPTHPHPSQLVKDNLERPGDDEGLLKKSKGNDKSEWFDKFKKPSRREADVAAGYFAVCREYVPGGVNGKPPERTTPIGPVVAAESPSVYQSMYRTIFDRNKAPTLDPGKNVKKARNVFFVVLRHGHLMLYDDSEQLEVRHVISLAHHRVTISAGGEPMTDAELWIRRNAICLERKPSAGELSAGGARSKPFFLFSENCSEKEDFYFALLQNQERRTIPDDDSPPLALQFDVKHIISLVQSLHSSEEHLQTRWINAFIGRLFLSLYKTRHFEDLIRAKITKKIARVKKPAFLSDIVLQRISLGEAGPYITNPRLKDLTVDGDCSVEADVRYTGNFRLEVAATARIELGSRFKAREVDLVLAVVLKKLEGHVIIRIKPPPSNRFWISFETMPTINMSIEPIVSSRQITYNIILRAIESRIREVIAETMVLPHWDDTPFTDTTYETYRGGIWADAKSLDVDADPEEAGSDGESNRDTQSMVETGNPKDSSTLRSREKTASMPALVSTDPTTKSLYEAYSEDAVVATATASSPNVDMKPLPSPRATKPKAVRAGSFTSASTPVVSMDTTTAGAVKDSREKGEGRQDAASAMFAISSRSPPQSPIESPVGSPSRPASTMTSTSELKRSNSTSSRESTENVPIGVSPRPTNSTGLKNRSSFPPSPSAAQDVKSALRHRQTGSTSSSLSFGNDSPSPSSRSSASEKRQSMIAITSNATAAAKKWGWNVLNKTGAASAGGAAGKKPAFPTSTDDGLSRDKLGSPTHPIGRGQPLPPPGTPLPHPTSSPSSAKSNRGSTPTVPRRKHLPPPVLPKRAGTPETQESFEAAAIPPAPEIAVPAPTATAHKLAPPALPKRRSSSGASSRGEAPATHKQGSVEEAGEHSAGEELGAQKGTRRPAAADDLFVISAPVSDDADSEPDGPVLEAEPVSSSYSSADGAEARMQHHHQQPFVMDEEEES